MMAELNEHSYNIILEHYMLGEYRIHERAIRLKGLEREFDEPSDLIVDGHTNTLNFLRVFGHHIKNLIIIRHPQSDHSDESIEIVHQIVKYCSKTITTFTIANSDQFFLGDSEYNFAKVVRLRVISNPFAEARQITVNFQLDRIYPILEGLDVSPNARRTPTLVRSYPRLKNLTVDALLEDGESLLQLNRQLRNLHIKGEFPRHEQLVRISQHLPYLQTITLSSSENFLNLLEQKHIIHFENVEHFIFNEVVEEKSVYNRFPITFDHLKTLKINSRQVVPGLIKLIEQNDRIKLLSMPWTVNFSQIVDVISHFAELEEIELCWSEESSPKDIEHLMKDFQEIKRITFYVFKWEDRGHLMEIIPIEWIFSQADVGIRVKLTFSRAIVHVLK